MKLLNPMVLQDIEARKELHINIGSGLTRRTGFYNLDLRELPGVDILADLNQPLDLFPANSVATLHCSHVLEHVTELLPLMSELHRVVRPDGRICITVPHFSNPYSYSDPTHVRFFGLYSFSYFTGPDDQPGRKVPSYYVTEHFRIESMVLRLLTGETHSVLNRFVRRFVEPMVNKNHVRRDWYERYLCRILPAREISVTLRPAKDWASIAA